MVTKEVPVEKIVERVVQVPQETIVEVPVERVVDRNRPTSGSKQRGLSMYFPLWELLGKAVCA